MTGRELFLRLIASWGGFGWERVRERYEQIEPPANLPPARPRADAIRRQLFDEGLVESIDDLVLTEAGRADLAFCNRARAEDAAQNLGINAVSAALSLIQALRPLACEIFEYAHDAEWERVSVALDVAAAAVGIELNPRCATCDDAFYVSHCACSIPGCDHEEPCRTCNIGRGAP